MKKLYIIFYLAGILGIFSCKKEFERKSLSALEKLQQGNLRFIEGKFQNQRSPKLLEELAKGQHPYAVIVSCSDSRISPNVLFDTDLGDLFIIRTAGNVLDEVGLASIEYAVEHLKTKLVVIMGHKNCGVIQAYMKEERPKNHIGSVIDIIRNEPEEQQLKKKHDTNCVHYELANVEHQFNYLMEKSLLVKSKYDKGELKVVKAYLNTANGKIEFLK